MPYQSMGLNTIGILEYMYKAGTINRLLGVVVFYASHFQDSGKKVFNNYPLFSYRISHLTEHMKQNRKDYSTERALTMLVGKRRALLDYLKARDIERYRALVKELGLRK